MAVVLCDGKLVDDRSPAGKTVPCMYLQPPRDAIFISAFSLLPSPHSLDKMTGRVDIPMTGHARSAIVGICFLWVIFVVTMGFRLLGRHRGIGIGLDDALAVLARFFSGFTIYFNVAVSISGVGYDLDPNSELFPKLLNNLEFCLKITFVFTLVYLWTLAALKVSQLWFYYRAFYHQLKIWIYIVGAIVVVWGIVFTFVFTFLCDPVSQQWTLKRIGHCMDQLLLLKCLIMTNVLTDIMIIVLPMSTVWKLQMRMAEKVAVMSCFAIGLACVIIGIVRFWQIFVIDIFGNFTGTSLTTFNLCTVELNLAGICINIPMLRPFYLRWRQNHKSSANDSSGYSTRDGVASKGQRSGNMPTDGSVPRNYNTTWIELDDKGNETDNDRSSETKLTTVALGNGTRESRGPHYPCIDKLGGKE
ncbi:hypothetical protein B0H67DRAFT_326060 [Lasiosphaeris hirsuta]|uniref:Rhodopsin domain-containing protein n=1 Tax=Lasiosphaeris hirsuta TaxID=260670 RepID=A0AA40A2D6_9PEZI|nr:hypothetical protein B0H67DRAFT_326060 [Lasiosphaeris hirsuta]